MDDEEYARELFEILTRPLDPDEPVDSYGTGSDRIDRYGGFGTEVRVTSIDVVPGPYGAQLEVGFVLDLPPGLDIPDSGSIRLLVEREWRELGGYAEPEDYAPVVAGQVQRGARDHVVLHTEGPRPDYEAPDADAQRALLMHVLRRWGEVEQPADDRYVVRLEEGFEVTVLITPDQWEQVLRRHGPPRDHTFDYYEEALVETGADDERFLVVWEGDFARSVREELPPVASPRPPLREIRRRIAEAEASGRPYGWFAFTPRTDDELPG
ncbi:hypothetical protein [Nocardioides sp. BE266]|uniref:hypothetical protein n=1 Tax=Nocardioides sp. BE266 TaxID=2817725 RepID=UPI00286B0A6D|nr:hypothetical protein [Nocardioides sp. BE266]